MTAWRLPAQATGRRAALVTALLGPRFIDVPIRALALIIALAVTFPGSAESNEPLYLVLNYSSYALIVVASFIPVRAAILAAILFLGSLSIYPEYLNPFQGCLEFASAVLLATGRWRLSLGTTAITFGLTGASQAVQPEIAISFAETFFIWGLGSVLALSALILEKRIRREIEQREKAAVAHEKELQQLRLEFVIDAHDTISHGLATQAAVLRVLSSEIYESATRRTLGELAVINDRTQQQFRTLLLRLRNAHNDSPPAAESPHADLCQALDSLIAAAEAGGYSIQTKITLPDLLSPKISENVLLISRELVTNIVKHASAQDGCLISIRVLDSAPSPSMAIESINPTAEIQATVPHSLSTRIKTLGGTCTANIIRQQFVVTAILPLQLE